jgi:peroxiredoxin
MKQHYLLPGIGALIALNGFAFAFTEMAWLAPWIALMGMFAGEPGFKRAASLGKFWLMALASVFLCASCFLLFHPWLGMGLTLAIVGHMYRMPLLNRWGLNKNWWLDPLICFSGLALCVAGALKTPGWQPWAFVAFGGMQAFFTGLGTLQSLAIQKSKLGGYAVMAGRPAPDFTLPDENGAFVGLSSFRGKGHVLLIFVRGDWCPSCHITLRTYARNKARFQEKNVTLLAIGPDPVGVNRRMVEELGVPFKMLSDEGQHVAMTYGVQMQDPVSKQMKPEGVPLPASFLVDAGGMVRYTSRPERAGEFLNPETIFPVLEGLTG